MSTSATDHPAYPDTRARTGLLAPPAQRFAEVMAHQHDRSRDLPTLFADIVTYWRGQDRAHGTTRRLTYEDDLAGAYHLGWQDHAMQEEERPSGVLALLTGTIFGLAVCAVLFASGLVLGAVRWGW